MATLEAYVAQLALWQAAAIASFVAGAAAGIGALPVYLVSAVSRKVQDILLGGAAGVMLGATSFSLVVPGIAIAEERYAFAAVAAMVIGLAVLVGAFVLWMIHRYVPHEHVFMGLEASRPSVPVSRITLFVLAITLHNFPEGLAVGVGFGGGDVHNGVVLTMGIFLQNLPEGFVVALAVLPLGYSRTTAVLIALGTGAVETFGGLVGAFAVSISQAVLPWALGGAAGAMLFVISREMIPETHGQGHDTAATFAVISGFVLMMVLDVSLAAG